MKCKDAFHSGDRVDTLARFIERATSIGFGLKQSGNLLQGVGISGYEILLDGRITKWLEHLTAFQRSSARVLSRISAITSAVSDGFE